MGLVPLDPLPLVKSVLMYHREMDNFSENLLKVETVFNVDRNVDLGVGKFLSCLEMVHG